MTQNSLFFYKCMGYPIPISWNFFVYANNNTSKEYVENKNFILNGFSWEQKNDHIKKFIEIINKCGRIYRSIPFIDSIYLCNSITFNACTETSDIDIFCIIKPGYMWWARFWSVIFFLFAGYKRGKKDNIYGKFCLSFYCTKDKLNLSCIREQEEDIYLTYRISHLVLLYQENISEDKNKIFKENKWIKKYLPLHPLRQVINIETKTFFGKSIIKKILEFFCTTKVGNFLQKCIKYLRLFILIYKKKKLGQKGKNIVISDTMLKFYEDKRKIYNLKLHKYKQASQG